MAIFFFLVGMEIKHEIVHGELADVRRAALPIFGALGGMIVPALLFVAVNFRQPGQHGWGVPMATDIAFSLGVLGMVKGIPSDLKVFLLSLAIADDIGAIIVIAVFYSGSLDRAALFAGIVILAADLLAVEARHLASDFVFRAGSRLLGCDPAFGNSRHHRRRDSGFHGAHYGGIVARRLPGHRYRHVKKLPRCHGRAATCRARKTYWAASMRC